MSSYTCFAIPRCGCRRSSYLLGVTTTEPARHEALWRLFCCWCGLSCHGPMVLVVTSRKSCKPCTSSFLQPQLPLTTTPCVDCLHEDSIICRQHVAVVSFSNISYNDESRGLQRDIAYSLCDIFCDKLLHGRHLHRWHALSRHAINTIQQSKPKCTYVTW